MTSDVQPGSRRSDDPIVNRNLTDEAPNDSRDMSERMRARVLRIARENDGLQRLHRQLLIVEPTRLRPPDCHGVVLQAQLLALNDAHHPRTQCHRHNSWPMLWGQSDRS